MLQVKSSVTMTFLFQTRLEGIHRTLNSEESTLTQTKSDGLSDALRDLSTRKSKITLFQAFINLYFLVAKAIETIQPTVNSDFGETEQIDEELDPELALALRISLEEERARQEKVKE